MEIIEQLWLLKQIYSYENRGYDLENKTLVYRIPENISSEDVDALKKAGHFPNNFFKISHDEVMLSIFNASIGKVAKYFYSEQLYLMVNQPGTIEIEMETMMILGVNVFLILGCFVAAYRNRNLTEV